MSKCRQPSFTQANGNEPTLFSHCVAVAAGFDVGARMYLHTRARAKRTWGREGHFSSVAPQCFTSSLRRGDLEASDQHLIHPCPLIFLSFFGTLGKMGRAEACFSGAMCVLKGSAASRGRSSAKLFRRALASHLGTSCPR